MFKPRRPTFVCVAIAAWISGCGSSPPEAGTGGEAGPGSEGEASGGSGVSSEGPGSGSSGGSDGTTSGSGESSEDASSTGGTGVPGAWCEPIPSCNTAPPQPGDILDWNHTESVLASGSGGPNHRGRDMFYVDGEPQWLMGKFAYGLTDWDIADERVDLWLDRECAGDWELLGSVLTTDDGDHPTIEGVEDTGGRVYFEVPAERTLEPGRHRVHFVVRGDGTPAEAFIEVVPVGTPIFVSDIDGTLTTDETEEFFDLLSGVLPDLNPGADVALGLLAERGLHPFYLTARPEFLGKRTNEFIRNRGLPPGIVHTTLRLEGALGDAAETFKVAELEALVAKGLVPYWAFGNTDSDAATYAALDIQPLDHRVLFQFDDVLGGRRIDSYTDLVDEFEALPELCDE